MTRMIHCCGMICLLLLMTPTSVEAKKPLSLMDVFELEFASDPQVSPDGTRVVYVRNFFDVMKDRKRSNLWIVDVDGKNAQALTTGCHGDASPRWSPDGKRLLFISDRSGDAQIHSLWLDSGRTAQLTHLTADPAGPSWSPDGKRIAFVSLVEDKPQPLVKLPTKPEGAQWAESFKVIDKVHYRHDGKGYLRSGYMHLFVVSAEGGSARQLTDGPYHHSGSPWSPQEPVWTPDGKALIFGANRRKDADHHPLDTELYEVTLADGEVRRLTDRRGPDHSPAVSPDGSRIAYLGFDDRKQGYQNTRLYVCDRDGRRSRVATGQFDRTVRNPVWDDEGKGVYFLYDDEGVTRVGHVPSPERDEPGKEAPQAVPMTLASDVGGETLGRPYASGSFSVAKDVLAFTRTSPTRPADVAVRKLTEIKPRMLTSLNDDLLGDRKLAEVEEIKYTSSHDGRKVHGWILRPPEFDSGKKYPLILEIHGGPFANYGPRFSMEMQLYAAAGYVVFYCNPRGSTSYGEEFGNLIHHAYPGHDYDDLMSGVDAVVKRGHVDPERLFITGGSGGGVLTAWTIGKTDRFRAAVVGKPVINWHSFVLTADIYPFFTQYWFPAMPWEQPEHYHKRSPLSLVGNVKTPTMLLTGENDHRTPIAQSEEFYQALKLRKVPSVLVRVPGASHNIAARPSHLMSKVAHVLQWFSMHDRISQSPER